MGLAAARNAGMRAAEGRDRRLHRRRCAAGPPLAHLSRQLVPPRLMGGVGVPISPRTMMGGWPKPWPTRPADRLTCSFRTKRPAHTWLQHGVRRDALQEIGGFDPMFRAAGDDVDLCWRLRARLEARLRPRGRRMAPASRLAPRLLAPAARLRRGRSAGRAQVAGEIQRRRASRLERRACRGWPDGPDPRPAAHPLWQMGGRAVPVRVRARSPLRPRCR